MFDTPQLAAGLFIAKISPLVLIAIAWGVVLTGLFHAVYPLIELQNVLLIIAFVSIVLSVISVAGWRKFVQRRK